MDSSDEEQLIVSHSRFVSDGKIDRASINVNGGNFSVASDTDLSTREEVVACISIEKQYRIVSLNGVLAVKDTDANFLKPLDSVDVVHDDNIFACRLDVNLSVKILVFGSIEHQHLFKWLCASGDSVVHEWRNDFEVASKW